MRLSTPPQAVTEIALEAERLGANVLYRSCGWGEAHIDIFDAPLGLGTRLHRAGFELSAFRERYWRWCIATMPADPITDRPPS